MTIIVKAAVATIINYNRYMFIVQATQVTLVTYSCGKISVSKGLYYITDKATFYITSLFYKCKCAFDWYF